MDMLNPKVSNSGATWDFTTYQMTYDSSSNGLYIKRTGLDSDWEHAPLTELFYLEGSKNDGHDEL